MRILRAEIWACDDCTIWLCNGDLSGVADDTERCDAIQQACAKQGPLSANWDSETGAGIRDMDDACEVCASDVGTQLHRFAELGEGPEALDFDGAKEAPIVGSAGCRRYSENLYLMWAGAYGDTKLFVWADSFDSAFEELVEWLDDNAPGCLSKSSEILADMDDDDRAAAEESGEIPDHTTIGHTTLTHGDCIASWEWGGDEITYEPTVEAVRLLSA